MLVTLKKKKKKKWINQLDYIGYIPLLISGKINILIWTYCSHFYPEGTIKLLYIYIYISLTLNSLVRLFQSLYWRGPSCKQGGWQSRLDPGLGFVVAHRLWRACLEVGYALSGPRRSLITLTPHLHGWQLWRQREGEREGERLYAWQGPPWLATCSLSR